MQEDISAHVFSHIEALGLVLPGHPVAIIGVYWGDSTRRHPAEHLADLHQLAGWFAEGKICPVISERVGLDSAADAIARIANRQVKGKVVVVPG